MAEKFYDGRFPFAILDLDESEALGAKDLRCFSQFLDLSSCDPGKSFRDDRLYDATGIERAPENFETTLAKIVAKIDKWHAEAAIGFVAAVAIDRLKIGEPVERRFDFDVASGLEDRPKHSFSDRENVIRRDERRFDIYLSELRLPVRAQVFVAKTSRDLKIFFYARY